MYDPERYRDKAEVERWTRARPDRRCSRARLRGRRRCSTTRTSTALEAEVAAEIDDAVAFAEAAPLEPVEDLTRFVYSRGAP